MQSYPVQALFSSIFRYSPLITRMAYHHILTKQHYHYLLKIAFTKYNIQSYWMQEFTREIVMDLGRVSVLNTLSTEINQFQVVETSPIKRFLLLTTFDIRH